MERDSGSSILQAGSPLPPPVQVQSTEAQGAPSENNRILNRTVQSVPETPSPITTNQVPLSNDRHRDFDEVSRSHNTGLQSATPYCAECYPHGPRQTRLYGMEAYGGTHC